MQVCTSVRSLQLPITIPGWPAQADCACSRRITVNQRLFKVVLQQQARAMASAPSTPQQAGPRQMLQLEDYTVPRWANALSAHVRVYNEATRMNFKRSLLRFSTRFLNSGTQATLCFGHLPYSAAQMASTGAARRCRNVHQKRRPEWYAAEWKQGIFTAGSHAASQ